MNNIYTSGLLAVTLLATTSAAFAEATFRPRASIGFSTYALGSPSTGGSDFEATYMKGGVGGTITFGRAYLDLGYSTSLGAEYDAVGGFISDDFDRTDLTVTLGVPIGDGGTLFGGYKTGKSEYTNLGADKLIFEADGFYFGGGFASAVGDGGVVSLNGAIAILTATLTEENTSFPPAYDAEADSIGFSLGAAYTLSLTDSMLFSLKGALQSYTYVDWVDPNYPGIPDLDETFLSVDAEFTFIF